MPHSYLAVAGYICRNKDTTLRLIASEQQLQHPRYLFSPDLAAERPAVGLFVAAALS